jgi:FlaA1/EpsC-like NDP-sugar epimerase
MPNLRTLLFAIVDRLSRPQKRVALLMVDTVTAPLALLMSSAVIYNALPNLPLLARLVWLFPAVAAFGLCWSAALGMHRVKLNAYESRAILRTGIVALLVTASYAVAVRFGDAPVPNAGIILFGLIFFLMSVGARMALLHLLMWVLRTGQQRKRVLIYGAGNTGVQLAAALRAHDSIYAVGFVDDNASLHGMSMSGLRIWSSVGIERLAHDLEVDRVLLAMPSVSAPKLSKIARRLQALGLAVMSVPSFAQLIGEEALIDTLTPVMPGRFLGRQQVEQGLAPGIAAYDRQSVMVSGAGGSVGSELCRQLLAMRPRRLVLFEVSEIALYNIDRELRELAEGLPIEIVPVLGSNTDSRMARAVMVEHCVEVVLHAAAYKHVPLVEANPIAGLANNVLGTRTMGDAANEAGVKRFVLISTDKAVRPTNIMGASKRLAELVVQDLARRSNGTVFSMVRFGNVLGSSGSVIPLFKEQIARGGPVTLTHEDVTRYFMTISEAAQLVLLAGSFSDPSRSSGGDVYVLDMGKPVRIRDLAVQMIEAAGYSVRDGDQPEGDIEILVTGLRPGEKLHEELLIGEGLLTTPHPKILRAEERCLSELKMAGALRALRAAVTSGDAEAARQVVRDYVEEFSGPAKVAAQP